MSFELIDQLDRLVSDEPDAVAEAAIADALEKADPVLRARILGVRARLHQRAGQLGAAANLLGAVTFTVYHDPRAHAELLQRQTAFLIETGDLSLANTMATVSAIHARSAGLEDSGRAIFVKGRVLACRGEFPRAIHRFLYCEKNCSVAAYTGAARVNRAMVLAKLKRLDEAAALLQAMPELEDMPRADRAYWYRCSAMIAAGRGRFAEAVTFQEKTAEYIGEHRLFDLAAAAAELAAYQVRAGQQTQARATLVSASRLTENLPRRDKAAGALLTKLVRMGLEGQVTARGAMAMAHELRQLNPSGRPTRKRGRPSSARRRRR